MEQFKPLEGLVLYSGKDVEFREHLEPYFKSLEIGSLVIGTKYHAVEEYDIFALDEAMEEYDLFFFLTSMDLLTHDLMQSTTVKKLIKYHHFKRVAILPIWLKEVMPQDNLFGKIQAFPISGHPVTGKLWTSYDEAYVQIFKEIRLVCEEQREYRQKVDEAWRVTQKENEVVVYHDFLEKYPRSSYGQEDLKKKEQLQEEQLWKDAREAGDVKGYFKYLVESPLNKYRFSAALNIYEIEENDEINWKDATENRHPKLYYHYKNKFPKGAHVEEANKEIEEKLATYYQLNKLEKEKLDANYLDRFAFENLDPTEIFALTTYTQHLTKLREGLDKLAKKLKSDKMLPVLLIAVVFVFEFSVYTLLSRSGEVHLYFRRRGTLNPFTLLLAGLNIYLLIRCYLWHVSLTQDETYVSKAINSLKSLSVLLKTSLINHEQGSVQTILKFSKMIEEKTASIKAKSFWTYLLQNPKDLEDDPEAAVNVKKSTLEK